MVTTAMKHPNPWITVGKTLAYTSVQFYNSKGQLAARGSHTKYSFRQSLRRQIITDFGVYLGISLEPWVRMGPL